MDLRSAFGTAVTVLLVVTALVLVVGQLMGQPVLIGYVETDSMEPTLEVGDGFIAVPTAIAGDPGEGDVVTFEAQHIDDGGMTTHRIVNETAQGYITRGDGNPFTDQDAGEPTVQDSQIVAVALAVDGEVVVLPSIGDGATAVQQLVGSAAAAVGLGRLGSYTVATTTMTIGVVLIVATLLYDLIIGGGRRTTRSADRIERIHSRWILLGLVGILLLPVMTMMVIPSDTTTAGVQSVSGGADDDPARMLMGTSEEFTYTVENSQFVPKVVVIESRSEGLEFSERVTTVSHGEHKNLSMTISVPDEPGVYGRTRAEYHYLHLLPVGVIVALHSVHPYLAMLSISLVALSPIILLFIAVVGLRPISLRSVHD